MISSLFAAGLITTSGIPAASMTNLNSIENEPVGGVTPVSIYFTLPQKLNYNFKNEQKTDSLYFTMQDYLRSIMVEEVRAQKLPGVTVAEVYFGLEINDEPIKYQQPLNSIKHNNTIGYLTHVDVGIFFMGRTINILVDDYSLTRTINFTADWL